MYIQRVTHQLHAASNTNITLLAVCSTLTAKYGHIMLKETAGYHINIIQKNVA